MAQFDKYVPTLKKWEGSTYVNDPADAGGATYMGITLSTFQVFYGADKTERDLQRMTDQQWRHIMKTGFWDKCQADMIHNQSVAEIFVDWCVNSGTGMIKKVQGMVGTKVDGIVGPRTIAAINAMDARRLHYLIKSARAEWFSNCVKNRSANLKWYDGWMNRLIDFQFRK